MREQTASFTSENFSAANDRARAFFQDHTYHLIHHMYPRIPFYDYGTAYYGLENELASVGAKVRRIGA